MRKILICTAAMILSVCALGAQDGVLDRDGSPDALGALGAYLDLTSEQVDQLKALQAEFIEEIRKIQQEIQDNKSQIRAELQSEYPDANLIGQLVIEVKKLNEEKKAVKARFHEPALAVLTPEQVRLLGPLQMALRLIHSAQQAVHYNLIVGGDREENGEDSVL